MRTLVWAVVFATALPAHGYLKLCNGVPCKVQAKPVPVKHKAYEVNLTDSRPCGSKTMALTEEEFTLIELSWKYGVQKNLLTEVTPPLTESRNERGVLVIDEVAACVALTKANIHNRACRAVGCP